MLNSGSKNRSAAVIVTISRIGGSACGSAAKLDIAIVEPVRGKPLPACIDAVRARVAQAGSSLERHDLAVGLTPPHTDACGQVERVEHVELEIGLRRRRDARLVVDKP